MSKIEVINFEEKVRKMKRSSRVNGFSGMIKMLRHSVDVFEFVGEDVEERLQKYSNLVGIDSKDFMLNPTDMKDSWNSLSCGNPAIFNFMSKEVNKEKYDAILKRFKSEPIKDEVGMYKNEAFDNLLKEQSWVCPIEYEKINESAFYSPKRAQIVVPSKKQFNISNTPEDVFKDGMEFYGTTIHEMAHSTGHESRLGRDGIVKIDQFGSDQYAKEELVAELTSALIGNAMGFDSRIRENNIAYLQNWIGSLKKDPKFLKSVMSDVNKSSKMVLEHIDEQRRKLGEKALLDGSLDGVEENNKYEQHLDELKAEDGY